MHRKMLVDLIIIVTLLFFSLLFFKPIKNHAEENPQLTFSAELDAYFLNNQSIRWSGTESTFKTKFRPRLGIKLADDVDAYVEGLIQQDIAKNSISYDLLKEDEAQMKEAYINFKFRKGDLQTGLFEIPSGLNKKIIDSVEDIVLPRTISNTRENDTGAKWQGKWRNLDYKIAVVNGEGDSNLDTNSDKSLATRLETEIEKKGFLFKAGLFGYYGTKGSTPVKEAKEWLGAFSSLQKGKFLIAAQYVKGKHGYLKDPDHKGEITDDTFNYSDYEKEYIEINNIAPYPRRFSGYCFILGYRPRKKLELKAYYDLYDPNTKGETSQEDKKKESIGFTASYELRDNIKLFGSLVRDNDPDNRGGPCSEEEVNRGDNKILAGVAVYF